MLKAGDALHINVAGEEDLSGGFAVKDDGTVRMELLGAVPAAGLSVAGFAEQLRRAWRRAISGIRKSGWSA